jgi:DNA ligase (NAD+)
MDVDGLGDEIMTRLEAEGLVTDVASLYRITPTVLATLDTGRVKKDGSPVVLGPVVAGKLVAAIDASRTRPLARVLFGLGIRHVGATVADALRARLRVDRCARACLPRGAATVEGVGRAIAESVAAFFGNPENRLLLERLKAEGVAVTDELRPVGRAAARGDDVGTHAARLRGGLGRLRPRRSRRSARRWPAA